MGCCDNNGPYSDSRLFFWIFLIVVICVVTAVSLNFLQDYRMRQLEIAQQEQHLAFHKSIEGKPNAYCAMCHSSFHVTKDK